MTYEESLAYISKLGRFGMKLGTERTRAILDHLGNPEQGLRGALIAGTNGKGSTAACLASILQAAGRNVGFMPKPHLISYTERIQVNGVAISEQDFVRTLEELMPALDAIAMDIGQATEFEMLTAMAIAYLVPRIDRLVCEVGLGGRLDATNALDLGVAVITNVDLDHQKYLGDTIEQIAHEKAAIIKPGNRAVTGATEPGLSAIRARSLKVGATLSVVGAGVPFTGRSAGMHGVLVDSVFDGHPISVSSPLRGAFQVANIATAIAVSDALRAEGAAIDAPAVVRGCETVHWAGRMDWIDGEPAMLIDGAHNPAGMAAMVASARELIGARRTVAIFGAMRNKDVESMAAALRERLLVACDVARDETVALAPVIGVYTGPGAVGFAALPMHGSDPAAPA